MKRKDLYVSIAILNVPLILLLVAINILLFFTDIATNKLLIIGLSLSIIVIVDFVLYYLLVRLKKEIENVEYLIEKLANGDISPSDSISSWSLFKLNFLHKLIGSVFTSLNSILAYLTKIANNDLETDYQILSENDVIGKKLVELKESLKQNRIELEKSKAEDEKRNWEASGLAKFSDILRQEHNDIHSMAYSIISNLVDYVGFIQGGLFVVNEEDSEDIFYELVGSVAYNRKKLMDRKVSVGESLVGRCAFEKKTIYLKDIPQNYVTITSGMGDANPNYLLLVPCLLDEKVFGIIEIASFNDIEKYQIEFIEKLGESIASSIATARTQEKTNTLLKASKQQSEELATQEEELRQNLEEMETTQEDLKRQMELNADIKRKIEYEKFLFDSLLDKIPARVIFKDRDCKFIKASKSAVKKFGKESYEEMVGLSDADFLDPEFAQKTRADEQKIMNSREGIYNFIEYEKLNDGSEVWKTVSKIPLINDEDDCIGIVGIITDISEYKHVEIENERNKDKYNKVLEFINETCISLTLSPEGIIKSINSVALKTFKLSETETLNKNIDELLKPLLTKGMAIKDQINDIELQDKIKSVRTYKVGEVTFELNEQLSIIETDNQTKELVLIANFLN